MILTPTFNENTQKWEVESPISNTWIEVRVRADGSPMLYRVYPNEGYVLHDNNADAYVPDPETEEMTLEMRYHTGMSGCALSYDFAPIEMQAEGQTVTAYGDREFYTLPVESVPKENVF